MLSAEGATLLLLETYLGDDVGYVADTEIDIRLAEGASIERVIIAEDGEGAVSVSMAEVTLSARSQNFSQTALTTGAKRQRLETRIAHPGAGAAVRMDGVYLLTGKRHADITTVVDHIGPGGETDQMIKGVVADQARGVFQGRIVVAHGSDQTNARMKHDALILSDQAEVDAKPELEIYADDVACAHGNTVGALDDEALFYAAQRGIPEDLARAMLTRAFVETVVDRIEHGGAREVAQRWIAAKLGVRVMSFDVAAAREQFPILKREINGKPLIYLDTAASAQKPSAVMAAMTRASETSYANVHRGLHTLANETTGKPTKPPAKPCAASSTPPTSARSSSPRGPPRRSTLLPPASAATLGPATRSCSARWSTTPTSCRGISCASGLG